MFFAIVVIGVVLIVMLATLPAWSRSDRSTSESDRRSGSTVRATKSIAVRRRGRIRRYGVNRYGEVFDDRDS